MRPWASLKRLLALVVTVIFAVGVLATPVFAKSRSFSGGSSKGFSSGSRSFSTPKPSTPSAPSRSLSTPKPSTSTPSTPAPSTRSFSTPKPSGSTTESKNYSSPSQNYSSGSRNYSSESRSFSSQRPSGSTATKTPPPTYDVGKTSYPSRPPVVVVGPTSYDPWYWHDWYYGRPWYWRVWHRPVYYGDSGWGISWVTVLAFGVGVWVLLGFVSAMYAKRRR